MWEAIRRMLSRWRRVQGATRLGVSSAQVDDLGDGVDQAIQGGTGNVQVGMAYGDVCVRNHSHTQHISHVTIIQSSEQLPAQGWQEVLRMIRGLPPRKGEHVFRFMERKFHTRMVRNLKAGELQEVRWYAGKIAKDLGRPSRVASVQSKERNDQ